MEQFFTRTREKNKQLAIDDPSHVNKREQMKQFLTQLSEKMKNLAVYDTEQIKREKMEPFSTWTPENCKLRAIDDFDPGQMNGREELELRDILATDTGIKRQNDPYTVALTFKRGDRIEKIPCNNVSETGSWWMVMHLNSRKIGFIPRNRVAMEADYQPSETTLYELPLELLDAILEKSLLHWMLHSPTHQRDEDIIRTLTSVDFCFLQRITRRRFNKRIWKQLKNLYGKRRKNSAIIRNNRNYLLANIQSDSTLIVSLLSSDCITEAQSHLIQRQRSIRYRNNELLCAMRPFDVAKFSNFVKCLRQTNQKTVARIMENGGGVMKVEVQNDRGTICTTSTETQLLLHQNIVDRRHRIKPCSLQSDKLISQLNGEGIEILNSQLDRQTMIVWIWCRSQTALYYIQRLFESNQLRKVLYGVADIPISTPEVEQSNVIIENNQFKKIIVVCPISINFTQRIDLGKFKVVIGITKLRNEIYIMHSPPTSAMELSVFEDRIPFRLKKKMEMNEFDDPVDMLACEKESCLYVLDCNGRCVWKISIETEKQHKTIKWLTFDYVPWSMSMTCDGELLIINRSSSTLMIYGSDAELLRSIQLPTYIKDLQFAVKTSIGNFVIINYEEEKEEEEEEEKEEKKEDEEEGKEEEDNDADEEKEGETGSRQRKHKEKRNYFVREFTSDGQTVIRHFVPSNETQQLNIPVYLSIDSDDQVFVADYCNQRAILLDSDLKWKCILSPTKDEEERKIFSLWRLCYDEEKRQLIVGCIGAVGANVYNLSRN